MSTITLITAEQFDRMSFDTPVELIRGEIVHMTNPGGIHGRVCCNVPFVLETWARQQGLYIVLTNDTGIRTQTDPDTVRGPDVIVLRRERLTGDGLPRGHLRVPPDVAIEFRSPNDRWKAILQKVGEFLRIGVTEVWIVEPQSQHVHIFRDDNEPTIVGEDETLKSQALPEFACCVSEFFRGLDQATPE